MDHYVSKLDTLPIELLHRMCSFGPCESALTLLKVNRRLHQACNDRQVFKSIIENRNGYGGKSWTYLPLTLSSPVENWARYALADSKARRLMDGDGDGTNGKGGVDDWLPKLMASQHPILEGNFFSNLLPGFVKPRRATDPSSINSSTNSSTHVFNDYAKALCIALRLLTPKPIPHFRQDLWGGGMRYVNHDTPRSGKKHWDEIIDELHHPLCSYEIKDPAKLRLHQKIQTLLALGTFAVYIRDTPFQSWGRSNVASPSHIESPKAIGVPSSKAMPFHDLLDLPLPFESSARERLLYCHRNQMTSKTFLEDGEWVGCYCTSVNFDFEVTVDPPMVDIYFVLHPSRHAPRALQGYGRDAIGEFDLEGFLNQQTCDITMEKRYSSGAELGTVWLWRGYMTPFGIAGYWGGFQRGGWFWLWKRHWVPQTSRS